MSNEGTRLEGVARLLSVMASLSQAITRSDVAHAAVSQGRAALGAIAGSLGVISGDGEAVDLLVVDGLAWPTAEHLRRIPLSSSEPMAAAARHGSPRWVEAVDANDAAPCLHSSRALACLPLFADGRTIGVLAFGFADTRSFDVHERAFLLALAQETGQAMERARLYEAERTARALAEEARERAAFLVQATEVLATSHDYASGLSMVARLAVARVADACLVDLMQEGVARRIVAARDERRRAALASLDEGDDGVAHGFTSSIRVPMMTRGRSLGAIRLLSSRKGKPFGQEDLAMLVELARHAALAIENARLHHEAQAALQRQRESLAQLETERARLDEARREAERANRMKDEFLATVSHELRAPLAALLMWEHVLRSNDADPVMRGRALEAIRVSARLQSRLIEDLLDVSRCISGKMHLDCQPTRLSPLLQDAIDGVREEAWRKQIHVDLEIDADEAKVMGDAARLQQIIANLLSNAVKFTGQGGHVHVRLEHDDANVRLVVQDDGEGISAEFLPHVFETFRQADGTSTRAHGGLGLGLAVVKHLVGQHGGEVRAESPGPGRGSTFTVELPLSPDSLVQTDPGLRRVADLGGYPAADALRGIDVLVVDDEEDVRDGMVAVLEDAGARVRSAGSVPQALEAMMAATPDVLLSDIAMPGEDGYSLIQKVRVLDAARGSHVHAVAVTARATETDRAKALAAGFSAHLAKPFEPPELVAVVAMLATTGPGGSFEAQAG